MKTFQTTVAKYETRQKRFVTPAIIANSRVIRRELNVFFCITTLYPLQIAGRELFFTLAMKGGGAEGGTYLSNEYFVFFSAPIIVKPRPFIALTTTTRDTAYS